MKRRQLFSKGQQSPAAVNDAGAAHGGDKQYEREVKEGNELSAL